MAQLSGKSGFVLVGATAYGFDKWGIDMESGVPDVTNWTSGGFQELVTGVVKGTVTVSGPLDSGSMPLVVNTTYTFHLGFDTGVELSASCIVASIKVDNATADAPRVSVTARSSGVFTAAIA